MIQVFIRTGQNGFEQLEVSGHADSGPLGQDIVCSAVSAVIIGGLNNLKNPENFKLIVEDGHVLVEKKSKASDHDEIVLETIIVGLKSIAESKPKFIKIKKTQKGS